MAQEFEVPASRHDLPFPPPMAFPEKGASEQEVLDEVREHFDEDLYEVERNFGITYVGPPHPITERVAELAAGSYFVEWARHMLPGTYRLEKEAVRMMGSLLGNPNAVGFITSGGTESNMSAMRLARNIAKKPNPEMVMPVTAHYSFRLGAELLGIRLHEVPVGPDFKPDMRAVEAAINANTVGLICSAPEGNFGIPDPVEEFADLAQRKGLYLHVDAAFGGFILPFMRELGYDVPAFDFSLPGVSSIMTDGHKLGLLPVATGFFLVRDAKLLEAIPTEQTFIHTLTATKPGEHAAAAWAVMQHLGREGYRETVGRALEARQVVVDGVESIEGMRMAVKPVITVLTFTSDVYDVEKIYQGLHARGWGCSYGHIAGIDRIRLSLHPFRDAPHAGGFVQALEEAVADVKG